ncbi:hypothetical protein CR513_44057, partial [Mucuna pruriens]
MKMKKKVEVVAPGNGDEVDDVSNPDGQCDNDHLGQGHREKCTSIRLRDYVTNIIRKMMITTKHELVSFHEVVKDSWWRKAMQNEIYALENNET